MYLSVLRDVYPIAMVRIVKYILSCFMIIEHVDPFKGVGQYCPFRI